MSFGGFSTAKTNPSPFGTGAGAGGFGTTGSAFGGAPTGGTAFG